MGKVEGNLKMRMWRSTRLATAGGLAFVALATSVQLLPDRASAYAPQNQTGSRWEPATNPSYQRGYGGHRCRHRLRAHGPEGQGPWHGGGHGGWHGHRGGGRGRQHRHSDEPGDWSTNAQHGGGNGTGTSAPTPSNAERETAEATKDAAIISALALALALIGIFGNRFQARQRLTYDWVERIGDLQLIESKAVMASFLRGGLPPPGMSDADWAAKGGQADVKQREEIWKALSTSSFRDDRRTVLQILALPNMLEALAGMYNQHLLSPGIVKAHVGGQADWFWTQAKWWVAQLETEDPKGHPFEEIDKMLKDLETRNRPRRLR